MTPSDPIPPGTPPSAAPAHRIVTSQHLVSARSPELSEVEFGLAIVGNAYERWLVRCMASAGQPELGALDVLTKPFPPEVLRLKVQRALELLGPAGEVSAEFQKLRPATWLPVRIVRVMAGVLSLVLLAELVLFFQQHEWDAWLCAHVFTLGLSQVAEVLLWVLGICFVIQRSLADFSSQGSASAGRPSLKRTQPRLSRNASLSGSRSTALRIIAWARSRFSPLSAHMYPR